MMRSLKIFVLCAFFLLTASCASKPHEKLVSEQLTGEQRTIKVVSVMPSEIYIERSTVKGEQNLYEMMPDVSRILEDVAAEAIAGFDFEVIDNGITKELLDEEPEVRYTIRGLHEKIRKISIKGERDPTKLEGYRITDTRIQKGQIKIGYDAAPFAEDCGADALLFIRAGGSIHSAGKQALGAAAAVAGYAVVYYDRLYYQAFLVDGTDGTVLLAIFDWVSLDKFVVKDALPGNEKYEEALQKLEQDLLESFKEKLSKTLF